MKIDAVIPWVDGNDPAIIKKHRDFGDPRSLKLKDVGGDTRFANLGELFWCVASLNIYAPFINRIYIVTDDQNPDLEPFLDEHFPSGHIPVEIVDHKVIFRDYEQYLPNFNSIGIETMIWRIPGLSEHFLLLNDDFLICNPVKPEDFFPEEGKVICYGDRFSTLWAKTLRLLKPRKQGHEVVTFKSTMVSATELLGGSVYFYYLRHTPRPLLRSWFENYYSQHPEQILTNIRARFREIGQYSNQELQYLCLDKVGKCEAKATYDVAFFLQPKPKKDYVRGKLEKFRKGKFLFCCFNSLDLAEPSDRSLILDTVSDILGFKAY